MASRINPKVARQFITLWYEKRIWAKSITRWAELTEAYSLWQARESSFPTIEAFAQSINATPREAIEAAQELREMGFVLSPKENEERYAKRPKVKFPWMEFFRLLCETRSVSIVSKAYNLTADGFDKAISLLVENGVTIPELKLDALPQWAQDRIRLILNPPQFNPEAPRTLGSKYRVKRPKGKKRYYYNGTGVYRATSEATRGTPNIRPQGEKKAPRYGTRWKLDRAELKALRAYAR